MFMIDTYILDKIDFVKKLKFLSSYCWYILRKLEFHIFYVHVHLRIITLKMYSPDTYIYIYIYMHHEESQQNIFHQIFI